MKRKYAHRSLGVAAAAALAAGGYSPVVAATPAIDAPPRAEPTATTTGAAGGWVDQPVSFRAGSLTVYGTYRHPRAGAAPVPAALLIGGSGPVDRDGNEPGLENMNTLRTIAGWLSSDGVASLRYDKLGSGRTGLGGFRGAAASIGVDVFTQEANAAFRFLAGQPDVRPGRLAVAGHSEGALYALLLATAPRPGPAVHALMLLEPLSRRYLDTIGQQVAALLTRAVRGGALTAPQARDVRSALWAAIAQLRRDGTVPAALPGGLSSILSPVVARYLAEADRYDPQVLAARLPAGTPTLVSCSDADAQISCADASRVRRGAADAGARLDDVRLTGVDHVLKEDPSRTAANYNLPLPFSHALAAALAGFTRSALGS